MATVGLATVKIMAISLANFHLCPEKSDSTSMVEPVLSDPLLSKVSIIQTQSHSPDSI